MGFVFAGTNRMILEAMLPSLTKTHGGWHSLKSKKSGVVGGGGGAQAPHLQTPLSRVQRGSFGFCFRWQDDTRSDPAELKDNAGGLGGGSPGCWVLQVCFFLAIVGSKATVCRLEAGLKPQRQCGRTV